MALTNLWDYSLVVAGTATELKGTDAGMRAAEHISHRGRQLQLAGSVVEQCSAAPGRRRHRLPSLSLGCLLTPACSDPAGQDREHAPSSGVRL